MGIVIAVIAMSLLALFLGFGLGVAAKKLAVPVDPRVAKAIGALPGANCGGCGFPGCSGFAKAVAAGSAEPGLCAPGGADTASVIAEIFGLEAGTGAAMVAQVRCRIGADPDWEKYEYEGVEGCGNAALLAGGPDMCDFGCMGFLDCVKACPFDAIAANPDPKKPPLVDVTKCVGCGICVDTCPNGVIGLVPLERHPVVYCRSNLKGKVAKGCCIVACIACGKCARKCPEKAIEMKDNIPVIDVEKCTKCGKCIEGCPTSVIVMFHDLPEAVATAKDESDDSSAPGSPAG
jgi:electron transport complex protein RnfB